MKKKLVKLLAVCFVLSVLFAGTAVFAETEDSYFVRGDYEADGYVWMGQGKEADIVAAEGYAVSTIEDGTYGSLISLSEEDYAASAYLYLKHIESGEIHAEPLPLIQWDKTGPEGSVMTGAIETVWGSLRPSVTEKYAIDNTSHGYVYGFDGESGIQSVEYYLSESGLELEEGALAESLERAVGPNWLPYTEPLPLEEPGMYVIYGKVTDNVGNVSYVNSEGIIVYRKSTAETEALHYVKGETSLSEKLELNGNTIAAVKVDGQALTAGTDYVIEEDGTLQFSKAFFESLNLGRYEVTISYWPQGYSDFIGEGPDDLVQPLIVEDWGEPVKIAGIMHWVDETGATSVEINAHSFMWLRESVGGKNVWFGLECGYEQFELGSRFWVRMLDPVEDAAAWAEAYAKMDDELKQAVDGDKLCLLQIGVTSPDGEEYKEVYDQTLLEIQVDDDWNGSDLVAFYGRDGVDEQFEEGYVGVDYPEGFDEFVSFFISHFSCYGLFDELTEEEKAKLEENADADEELPNEEDSQVPDTEEEGSTEGEPGGMSDEGTRQPEEENSGEVPAIPEPEEDEATQVPVDSESPVDPEDSEEETSPATGDKAMTILWMGLALAAAGLFVQMKRRNS